MDVLWSLVPKIFLSALLGAILGIERARSGQSAGIRTNMMISTASCLFTFLGAEVFAQEGVGPQDTARVAAQVVTGVGFLGAGAMLQTKNKVRGLTTAATIWLVAAIGMSVGAGLYWGAIFVTIFAVIALAALAPVSNWLQQEAKAEQEIRKRRQKAKEEALDHWWRWRRDDDEDQNVRIED
jgi:putative Mg2+ transporter-C (MgtC) family protein